MIFLNNYTIEEFCLKYKLEDPRLSQEWVKCETCNECLTPYKPFLEKGYAGLDHDGICLNCGTINKSCARTYITTSPESYLKWITRINPFIKG
jgi:hypothetical protein